MLIAFEKAKTAKTTNRVVPYVPITNRNGNIAVWSRERDWNNRSRIDNEGAKTTRSFLEMERRKVEETPNLVLNLKLISPIPLWRNRTIGS